MDISVIVPLFNEEESLVELSEWIEKTMTENKFSFEVIMVDDGSKDTSWEIVEKICATKNEFRGIKFQRNYGKAAALHKGFETAKGDVIITMDADLQDSPDEIPELYRMIIEEKYDIVSGWKKKRYDPLSKRLPSKLYNGTVRLVTGIKLHDMNCGLKAYRKMVVKSIEVYGDMHRFIPVIAKRAGFKAIGEKVVQHQPRKFGVSKYGIERYIIGFLDLLSVVFISKFGRKPMHFFGSLGTLSFLIGFGIALFLTIEKFVFSIGGMTQRPLFFAGILAMIIGTQLFLTGFLGELITRNAHDRNIYLIEKEL